MLALQAFLLHRNLMTSLSATAGLSLGDGKWGARTQARSPTFVWERLIVCLVMKHFCLRE